MKRRLSMLLAVLLTGGILIACGPGDESAQDPAGGGIVNEPLGGDPGAADTFGDEPMANDQTVEMDLGGDENAAAGDDAGGELAGGEQAGGELAGGDDADGAMADDEMAGGDVVMGDGGDVAGGGAAAPAEGDTVVITFSQAGEGVAVENIEGGDNADSIAATGEENPELNLTVGERYEFVYDGEGDLVFFNSDNEPVLSSSGTDNAFTDDTDANVQAENGRMSFTLTEELAQQLDHYVAGPAEVGGTINAN